jgi:hypothetical protein
LISFMFNVHPQKPAGQFRQRGLEKLAGSLADCALREPGPTLTCGLLMFSLTKQERNILLVLLTLLVLGIIGLVWL